jgi:hypothetical protein
MTLQERFRAKYIVLPNNCWQWTGAKDKRKGYGYFGVELPGGWKIKRAHRYAYETLIGPIPDGLVIDHLCRNPSCVNPEHMEPVTSGENSRRGDAGGYNARKTHCANGHEFTPENTYWRKRNSGGRACRICQRKAVQRSRLKCLVQHINSARVA